MSMGNEDREHSVALETLLHNGDSAGQTVYRYCVDLNPRSVEVQIDVQGTVFASLDARFYEADLRLSRCRFDFGPEARV